MEKDKKYALLDTDFLFKSYLARNAANHTLAQLVLNFEDYEFFCHEMIKEELSRHKINPDPNPWLEENMKAGKIKLYSDRDIVNELSKIYKEAATLTYIYLFQISCDAFNAGFFEEHYGTLEYTENVTDIDCFLTALKACDDRIPHHNGLGEKKTYVFVVFHL